MNYGRCLFFIFLIFFSSTSFAEFYKYKDKNGNVRFTDDLSMVPKNQRKQVRQYMDSVSDDKKSKKKTDFHNKENAVQGDNQKYGRIKSASIKPADATKSDDSEKTALELRHNDLTNEYRSILKQKEQILKQKKSSKFGSKAKKYNDMVERFNKKMAQYEHKRKAYEAEVNAYNNMLKIKTTKDQKKEKK